MVKKIMFFVLAAFLFSFTLPAAAPVAKVVGFEGKVSLTRDGKDILLAEGVSLYEGDKISTAKEASCNVSFDESLNKVVTIEENSVITISVKKLNGLYLASGKVFSLVKKLGKGEKFEVYTPVAVCGVRGTGFSVEHSGGFSRISGYEGIPYVGGIDTKGKIIGLRNLRHGFFTVVKQFQRPANPVRLSYAQRRAWNKWKNKIIQMRKNKRVSIPKEGRAMFRRSNRIKSGIRERREKRRIKKRLEDLRDQRDSSGSGGGQYTIGGE